MERQPGTLSTNVNWSGMRSWSSTRSWSLILPHLSNTGVFSSVLAKMNTSSLMGFFLDIPDMWQMGCPHFVTQYNQWCGFIYRILGKLALSSWWVFSVNSYNWGVLSLLHLNATDRGISKCSGGEHPFLIWIFLLCLRHVTNFATLYNSGVF